MNHYRLCPGCAAHCAGAIALSGIVGFFAVGFMPERLQLGQGAQMNGSRGGAGLSPSARRRFF
ncbi:hypothetical protein [Sodalis sp. (in: enterobacteria)]|uniref:hypothetical protein n=1 Tax=Sodalis sp. (in: enterobacteria) TaxID=1898979 RepID=UPI003F687054